MRWGQRFITGTRPAASGNSSLSNANRRHTRTARSFEIRATRRASEASLGGLDRCMRLGPVEPKKWQALPEATLAARTHDFVAALITRAVALVAERPLVELCGLPTEQSIMGPPNNQPSMERQQMAPSAPWSAKRPPAAMPAPVAVEAPPTPPAPPRVLTNAPTKRPGPATATATTRRATRPGDIQGSMESAGAQQAQRSAASAGFASALPWGLASTAAVAAGCKFSPAFAKATIPSTRVALAISPPLFAFFLAGDLQIHRDAKSRGDVATARSSSTWPLQLANAFYNHTLIAFGMVITPMYGAILHSELSKPRYEGWRLSHAVIHTRVYGQAAAVGSLVLVFGFKDILRQNGAPFKVE